MSQISGEVHYEILKILKKVNRVKFTCFTVCIRIDRHSYYFLSMSPHCKSLFCADINLDCVIIVIDTT